MVVLLDYALSSAAGPRGTNGIALRHKGNDVGWIGVPHRKLVLDFIRGSLEKLHQEGSNPCLAGLGDGLILVVNSPLISSVR